MDQSSVVRRNPLSMSSRIALESARAALNSLRKHSVYREPEDFSQVLPSEFAVSDRYLGLGTDPYPHILDTLDEFCLGNWTEGVIVWGIGSGKTYLSRLFLMYMAASVLWRMREGTFWDDYDLGYGTVIELGCFAPTQQTARDVLFQGMRPLMMESPWFQRNFPVDPYIRSRIRFLRHTFSGEDEHWPLIIEPKGGSQSQRLGRNLFAVVIDETDFFVESAGKLGDQAQELIDTVRARIRSRFGNTGKLLLVSSANHVGSVCQRELEQARKEPDRIYAQRRATWEVKPLDRWPSGKACTVTVVQPNGTPLTLEGIPVELKNEFERNPQRALRDFGSIPSEALEPFDPEAPAIFEEPPPPDGRGPATLPPWRDPVVYHVPDWVTPDASLATGVYDCAWGEVAVPAWFIHIDLALTHDACGIALVHPVWLPRELDRDDTSRPPWGVVVDWTLRISAQDIPGQVEIDFNAVRGVVLQLRDRGFQFGRVTYDGYQSVDSRQLLRRAGIPTGLLSVDRTPEAYMGLKELLHTGRLFYGDGYWLQEYRGLELIAGRRVDHRAGGSKDVADAVAGATAMATRWLQLHEWGTTVELETELDEIDAKLAERYDVDAIDAELAKRYANIE